MRIHLSRHIAFSLASPLSHSFWSNILNAFLKAELITSYLFFVFLPAFIIQPCKSYAQPAVSVSDSLNQTRLLVVAGTGASIYAGGLSFLAFVWYKDHERVPFHFYNDLRGYRGMDKMGHAYAAYWESKAAYHALRHAGLDEKKAIIWGAPAGFLFQLPIELFDGLYEGWGFSVWDVAANTAGSALFAAQQAIFGQQHVLMKFSYSPSGYPKYHPILGETPVESFFLDYNGHTYWLTANLRSISGIQELPSWLNLAFGYSANGMIKEFENPTWYQGQPFPHLERYSQFILSPDIDWSKIRTRHKGLKALLGALNLLKVPFPAVEYNRVEGIRFHLLYY